MSMAPVDPTNTEDLWRVIEENTTPMPKGYTKIGLIMSFADPVCIAIWGPGLPPMKHTAAGWVAIDGGWRRH